MISPLAFATPRLTDWLGPWMIDATAAQTLLAALQGTDWVAHMREPRATVPQVRAEQTFLRVPAGKEGKSVAVVELVGELMKSKSSMGSATSTVEARRQIRAATNDPNTTGIMLLIDSPGGTVSGTADLANEVKAASRAGKPVIAQVEDVTASAAYWVASQADAIYANNRSARIGSIGTILTVQKDTTGKVAVFTSGPLKAPGLQGEITEEQTSYLQSLVDALQLEFDSAVKAGRKLSAEELKAVNTGAAFLASRAVELKLIDGIQSADKTLKQLGAGR